MPAETNSPPKITSVREILRYMHEIQRDQQRSLKSFCFPIKSAFLGRLIKLTLTSHLDRQKVLELYIYLEYS
jgi:hypothetical protein